MRHLGAVEIFRGRRARRGAHGAEHEGDVVVSTSAASPRRLRRREPSSSETMLSLPVDAALFVDQVEIAGKRLAGDAECRGRAAIGHDVAELISVSVMPGCWAKAASRGQRQREEKGRDRLARSDHASSPRRFAVFVLLLFWGETRALPGNRSCVELLSGSAKPAPAAQRKFKPTDLGIVIPSGGQHAGADKSEKPV